MSPMEAMMQFAGAMTLTMFLAGSLVNWAMVVRYAGADTDGFRRFHQKPSEKYGGYSTVANQILSQVKFKCKELHELILGGGAQETHTNFDDSWGHVWCTFLRWAREEVNDALCYVFALWFVQSFSHGA